MARTTAADWQTYIDNLQATIATLTSTPEQSVTMDGASYTYADLDDLFSLLAKAERALALTSGTPTRSYARLKRPA